MPETVTACPLCGGAASRLFDRRSFRDQAVTNRVCTGCGLVYQSPRMAASELAAFYEAEYRRLYQGAEGPNLKDLAVQGGRAQALLDFYRQAAGAAASPARHLDIGCSAGLLLQRFQQAYGCQPVGVEPGLAYRQYAGAQGLRVYPSLDELNAQLPEPAFDLVSLAHVLEHLPDPVDYLAKLRQDWLAPTGWLLVEVPNLYAHDCFEVAHLVSFSPHTLRQVLTKAGYEVAALQAHGLPRSASIPLYLTVLARPLRSAAVVALSAEGNVALKRRWGLARRALLVRFFPKKAWLPPIS